MVSAAVSAGELATIGIFEGLSPEAMADCATLATRRTLPARRIVFGQGEPSARFQVLVSGRIRICQTGRDGGLALMRMIGPGEPFGSFGMFVDGCYPAEATTSAPSVELSWSKADFLHLLERRNGDTQEHRDRQPAKDDRYGQHADQMRDDRPAPGDRQRLRHRFTVGAHAAFS